MSATASTLPPLPEPAEDAPAAAIVSEPLTWAEICARHPDEWVCLVDFVGEHETDFEFTTARVAGHGKTRKEPLVQARAVRARYDGFGHFYTGRIVAPQYPWEWAPSRLDWYPTRD